LGADRHGLSAQAFLLAPAALTTIDATLEGDEPEFVVDLGCGLGDSTLMLLARFPDARIVGVDINPSQLEVARNKLIPGTNKTLGDRVEFVHGDIADLPASARGADLALGQAVMGMLRNPVEAAIDVLRHVKREVIVSFNAIEIASDPRDEDERSVVHALQAHRSNLQSAAGLSKRKALGGLNRDELRRRVGPNIRWDQVRTVRAPLRRFLPVMASKIDDLENGWIDLSPDTTGGIAELKASLAKKVDGMNAVNDLRSVMRAHGKDSAELATIIAAQRNRPSSEAFEGERNSLAARLGDTEHLICWKVTTWGAAA
jgi:SAM-dependent methyltransferase